MGIHEVDVEYVGEGDHRAARSVRARFGDGHELRLFAEDGAVQLCLLNGGAAVILDASGPGCEYERAINLLRLHLPRRGAGKAD
jgi:hypothetical protein